MFGEKQMNVEEYFMIAKFINKFLISMKYTDESYKEVADLIKVLDTYQKFAVFNVYTPQQLQKNLQILHDRHITYTYTYKELEQIYDYMNIIIPMYIRNRFKSKLINMKLCKLDAVFELNLYPLDLPMSNNVHITLCSVCLYTTDGRLNIFSVDFKSNINVFKYLDVLEDNDLSDDILEKEQEYIYQLGKIKCSRIKGIPMCIEKDCRRMDTVNGLCSEHKKFGDHTYTYKICEYGNCTDIAYKEGLCQFHKAVKTVPLKFKPRK